MTRSNPNSASGDGGDRKTTPGVGDDSRATLPDALPPVRPSRDFKKTIPMGSSFQSDWPTKLSSTSQSGLHPIGAHAPSTRPPPDENDKRMIGAGDLGRTLRVMTVPPPAGGAPGRSSFPPPLKPPPIMPAPTIRLSPEIAIPTRDTTQPARPAPEPRRPVAPVEAPPRTRASTAPEAPQPPSPEANPTTTSTTPAEHVTRTDGSAWISARRWTLVFAAVAVAALLGVVVLALLFRLPAPPGPGPAAAASTNAAPPAEVDLRPATNIVTNPPGAEIVLRGALVANTPARIVRPSYESLYLLRLRGYQPQLVALSTHSPDTLHIDLQPLAGAAPIPATQETP